MHERRKGSAILGANGAPTRMNFELLAGQGKLAAPAMFPPLGHGDGQIAMPIVGGATRLEAVAAHLLAPLVPHLTGDVEENQRTVRNVVQLAVDMIQECNRRAHEVMETPNGNAGQAAAGDGPGTNQVIAAAGA